MKYNLPLNIMEVFEAGVDRYVSDALPFPDGPVLNLGAGKKDIEGTVRLDADMGWYAPILPYKNESVAGIFAFHFMEHLVKDDAIGLLKEVQRVLMPNGSMYIVTPHWSAECAFQDLDHKSFWGETTWDNLFKNPYYDGTMPRDWKLKVNVCLVMGVVMRNLVTVTQLVKV